MIIPVHMFAFMIDRNTIREVAIPVYGELLEIIDRDKEALDEILDNVFKYGQNDFQAKDAPSVSVGDVIQLKDRYFMVMGIGFKEISKEEFDRLIPPTSQYAYKESI
jgi:hypothetical protein